MLFLSAFIIGILNNLPTGPATAYLIAVRAKHNTWQSAIPLILGVLVADTTLIILIKLFSERFHQLASIHIATGLLSLVLIGLGIQLLRIAKREHLPVQTNTTLSLVSNNISIFIGSTIINLVNPSGVLSMALFLRAFHISPLSNSNIATVLAGYLIASACIWSLYTFLIHRMWHHWARYTKKIITICGIALIIFGCSYILHRTIEVLQQYLPEQAYHQYQEMIEKPKKLIKQQR